MQARLLGLENSLQTAMLRTQQQAEQVRRARPPYIYTYIGLTRSKG